jgi:hypothetical protein
VLSDVELKIQGFDLGKLLGQVRTSVSPPDEINGFVEKTGGSSSARQSSELYASWRWQAAMVSPS